ncbi:hypothetical protein Mal52_52600 [Symmachiella dynata]|uniref:Uncharacterized protein n=1 Tax=Symmachiella dynata TaxID=2527995 RepID=A0A517ZWA4_9PLAN|nr:hypothetical protein [Symmachiella dynata]QDU46738.1 hypothetical protein Mal52_52600 [Symmachiella dynata]
MSQIDFEGSARLSSVIANFSARPASQSWERVPCGDSPQQFLWVWYKPSHLPCGVVVNIPDETFRSYRQRQQLTLRTVLSWLGLEPGCVWQWTQYGVTYDAQQGASAYFDQPLTDPVPGVDSGVAISLLAPAMPVAPPIAPPAAPSSAPPFAPLPGGPVPTDIGDLFENIDTDWKAIVKAERDLALCRKKLVDTLTRLGSLNRDLNHEEQLSADTADKAAWMDARRWLRETASRVSRYLKDCDVGDTTSAPKRDWMKQTYEQYIVPKQVFDGIQHAQREFEGYRKMVQTLFVNMNGAHASAVSDGERRAQQVLARIAAKVRKTKK